MHRLTDRWWRLNNLYYIIDKNGQKVQFRPNWAQTVLFSEMWYMNVYLKARQLGITTSMCIFLLDIAMFNSNTNCGIIAHNKEDAEVFFRDKVKYAYDNLPGRVKKAIPASNDTAKELKFKNNSSIRVGTSMRSTTLQYLHVSEYGKICARFPEKAKEIRTGALNTVQAGNYVFIESTAEGREGDFYQISNAALEMQRAKKPLTKLDFKFFFFPWHHHPDYRMPDDTPVEHPSDLVRYYEELKTNHGIILSPGQKAWYTKKHQTQQDEMKREFPSTPEEAFEAAVIGAYYANQLARARTTDRVTNVPHDTAALVHTCWDLGISDKMAIWFFQLIGQEVHWIDYYEHSDEGFPHYKQILDSKSYTYGSHIAPHDIGARELSSGQTRLEMAQRIGINFVQLNKQELMTGINQTRTLFDRCWFDEVNCSPGLKCLGNYRKDWNKQMGCFSDRPRHDENEHGASAFRYGAQAIIEGIVSNTMYATYDQSRAEHIKRKSVGGI